MLPVRSPTTHYVLGSVVGHFPSRVEAEYELYSGEWLITGPYSREAKVVPIHSGVRLIRIERFWITGIVPHMQALPNEASIGPAANPFQAFVVFAVIARSAQEALAALKQGWFWKHSPYRIQDQFSVLRGTDEAVLRAFPPI